MHLCAEIKYSLVFKDCFYKLNHFRTIGRHLMFAIFILYTASITLFTHVHVVGGVSIVHSHFYNFWEDDNSEVGILKILINCFSASDIKGAQYADITASTTDGVSDNNSVMIDIPLMGHQHSSDQLILFEMLSHFRKVALPLLLFLVLSLIVFVRLEIIDYVQCYGVRPFLKSYFLRGPPVSLLS